MASKEANRLKYQYNKKYVEAYWERKAQQQNGETSTKKSRKTVRQTTISCFDDDLQPEMADVEITVCRNGKSDERYIKALELANKRFEVEDNYKKNIISRLKKKPTDKAYDKVQESNQTNNGTVLWRGVKHKGAKP